MTSLVSEICYSVMTVPAHTPDPNQCDASWPYCVFTSASFSTWICSFDSKVLTESAGYSTLQNLLADRKHHWEMSTREALDERELVFDISTLGLCRIFSSECHIRLDSEPEELKDTFQAARVRHHLSASPFQCQSASMVLLLKLGPTL